MTTRKTHHAPAVKKELHTFYRALIMAAMILGPTLTAFTPQGPKNNTAEVQQCQGMYVFVNSMPVKEYTVLGRVKVPGVVWSNTPKAMFDNLIKRAVREYKDADAVIIDDMSLERATVIQFK